MTTASDRQYQDWLIAKEDGRESQIWNSSLMAVNTTKYRSFQPRPKSGIWPPPVYEAHLPERVVRMSFWSAKGKPIDASRIRAVMESKGEVLRGYIEHDGKRWEDGAEPVNGRKPRVTAKQAREGLGRLLACLDGTIADEAEIRLVVTECRKLAA